MPLDFLPLRFGAIGVPSFGLDSMPIESETVSSVGDVALVLLLPVESETNPELLVSFAEDSVLSVTFEDLDVSVSLVAKLAAARFLDKLDVAPEFSDDDAPVAEVAAEACFGDSKCNLSFGDDALALTGLLGFELLVPDSDGDFKNSAVTDEGDDDSGDALLAALLV